ncbi:hypothetical protein [Kribbella sp. CA-247076]|uniref:hypothetical protein n=1 Tax=Kribbella sp. CA-247076 TaxID=3239941 RepID=UPI003D8A0903
MVDDPGRTVHSTLGEAQRAVSTTSVDEVLRTADALGHSDLADMLIPYREAADQLAELELQWLAGPTLDRAGIDPDRTGADLDTLAERAVIGTILGDALLTAVRREAQKQASATRFR